MHATPVDLATLMDICNQAFYPQHEIVHTMTRWLRMKGARNLVDVAAGTGFPLIDLAKSGHDVTYVDGSPTMRKRFLDHANRNGLMPVPENHICRWGDLGRKFDRRFDALMCRGNSLSYANSWHDERDPKSDGISIHGALADFYRILAPGGWAYLDKYRPEQGPPVRTETRFSALVPFRDERWSLEWEVETLPAERKRIWRVTCSSQTSGARGSFELPSLLFSAEELVQACRDVGFEAVSILPRHAGEENFEVVEARRPDTRGSF